MEFKPELLSPAGSLKVLKAAANLGADAVYFGLSEFNARYGAVNFTNEEAQQGIEYLKKRNKKAYITLNTLIKHTEIPAFIKQIELASNMGADGIIVQDLGAVELIKKVAPHIELHASTQMAVHNLEGIRFLYENGFQRVVLAREVTLAEMNFMKENTDCEIEVFIHGAMCVSYSGQCYMSSFIGERSGNRGKCAQPCRLCYENKGIKGSLLSLKDMESTNLIELFKKMKIDSLKIEGRLKNEYYVATVVDVYRRLLDGDQLNKEDLNLLYNIFYRGGYTNYYEGKSGKEMFCFQKNENPYSQAEEKAKLKYKDLISDEKIPEEKKIPVDIKAIIVPFKPPILIGEAKGKTITVKGEQEVVEAKTTQMTNEKVLKSLSKFGETGYRLNQIEIDLSENSFLPVSELNELRRKLICELDEKSKPETFLVDYETKKRTATESSFIARVRNEEQFLWAIKQDCFSFVFVDYAITLKYQNKIKEPKKIVITLPRILSDEEIQRIKEALSQIKKLGITKAAASNLSHFSILKGFQIAADIYLNLFNSNSKQFLAEQNVFLVGASPELHFKNLATFQPEFDLFALGYGHMEAMITRNCIKKSVTGTCHKDPLILKDRKNEDFILLCANDCRNEILNPYPIVMSDKRKDFNKYGISYIMLSFTTESINQCESILNMYINEENRLNKFTRGHFYRGAL